MKRLVYIVLLALTAANAGAQQSDWMEKHRGAEVQLFLDNDKWAGSDRYYTNGIKIGFGVSASRIPGGGMSASAIDAFGALLNCGPVENRNAGVFVGQNMYTPRDISLTTPQPSDRPWAGWLYAGLVYQAQRTCGAKSEALDTIEVDVGVVGRAAQGEDVQNWWHRIINVPEARGWDNQIPDELAVLLTYLHKQKWKQSAHLEVIPHVGFGVGTVMTFARAGGMVRVGRNMTGFGPDRIEPGGAILQNFRTRAKPCPRVTLCEYYGFVGAEGRAVAYNIFLDGTVFRESPSVDRTPLVYDFTVGFSLRFDLLRFTMTRVTRSEEFTTPLRGGGKQTFHSFNLGFEF